MSTAVAPRPATLPLRPGERVRLAVDTGGTFTDLVVERVGLRERSYKVPSTPSEPSEAFFVGLGAIAEDLGLTTSELLGRVDAIVHGTTITTNALLTHTGAVTALVTTKGLTDTFLRPQGRRVRRFDSKTAEPAYLVPRHLVIGVGGRLDRTGTEIEPLDEADLLAAAARLRDAGVEAVAVSLIFSFINPAQEIRAQEILERELPGVFVTRSSAIVREMRLFQRTSTAASNAYVGPVLHRYLDLLQRRLSDEGYAGPVHIMQSNGGVITLAAAAALAVNSLLSGPAGGPPASTEVGQALGLDDLVMIDMGGTSFEVSLALGGRVPLRRGGSLAGNPLITPMLDIETMGAGGGSIASVTPGNLLQVGPASAGAEPGPACYGRGGSLPTVTDASLVLGYVDPDNFGDGYVDLDPALAEKSLASLAATLGLDVPQTAAAIHGAVNAGMADSIRLAAVRRGVDARSLSLVAGGGAGPIHAAALATALGISLIVVPLDASVLCARGMLLSELSRHAVRTVFGVDAASTDVLEDGYREVEADLTSHLVAEGVPLDDIRLERVVDLRYVGQIHEIEVVLPTDRPIDAAVEAGARDRFEELHLRYYGHVLDGVPVEPVNIRVRAWAGSTKRAQVPEGSPPALEADEVTSTPVRQRSAWFGGGFETVAVHDARSLAVGTEVPGPALVELSTSTVVVPPGWSLSPAPSGPLLLRADDATRGTSR